MNVRKLGWVRGKGKPLTHAFLLKLLSRPSPRKRRGEGASIGALFAFIAP
jgi:hypothetical protein